MGVPTGLGSAVAVAGGGAAVGVAVGAAVGVAVEGGVGVGRGAGWVAALQETPAHMATKSAAERTMRAGVEDVSMLSH